MFERKNRELTMRQEDSRYPLYVPHITQDIISEVPFYAVRVRTNQGEYMTLTDGVPGDLGRRKAARDLKRIRAEMFNKWRQSASLEVDHG